jgi:uncharacterized protein (TIGR02246 family)
MLNHNKLSAWRRVCLALFATLSLLAAAHTSHAQKAAQPAAALTEDEAAIRTSAKDYEKAFAAADAKALAALFAPDAELVDERSRTFKGRDEIEREFATIFADQAGATVAIDIAAVKFISPDVAIETGLARGQSKTESAGPGVKYTAVHVKRDGKWLLSNVNESRATAAVGDQRLAGLKWLVGDWQADLGDGKTYKLSCEWLPGENFLSRKFSVQENGQPLTSGHQVIGFDPVLGQIVSWTFDSSGGFGHEIWEEKGGRWRIAASSVLPDGATSLATNNLTKVNGNTFTWQSVERSLNDQLLPDTAEVRVERDMN